VAHLQCSTSAAKKNLSLKQRQKERQVLTSSFIWACGGLFFFFTTALNHTEIDLGLSQKNV